jgi:hypothetical protein
MDRTLIESSLLAAAEDVLDSMCFTALEGQMPVAALQWPGELLVELSVGRHLEFDGVCCGHFGLRMEAATARMIAGNLLGEDEEFLTEAQSSERNRQYDLRVASRQVRGQACLSAKFACYLAKGRGRAPAQRRALH